MVLWKAESDQSKSWSKFSEERNPGYLFRNRRESLNLSFWTHGLIFGGRSMAPLDGPGALAPLDVPGAAVAGGTFFPCLLLPPSMGEGRVLLCLLAQQSSSWQSCLLAIGAGWELPPGQKLKWGFSKMLNWLNFFQLNSLVQVPYYTLFWKAVYIFGKQYTFSMQSLALPRGPVPIPNPLLLPGIRADVGSYVHYTVA